ncbi:hypothetical protein KKI24_04845 [bacterium]|nr:hypothetical protein [bacterium]
MGFSIYQKDGSPHSMTEAYPEGALVQQGPRLTVLPAVAMEGRIPQERQ